MKKYPAAQGPLRVFIADSSSMGCQLMARALQQSREPIEVAGSASNPVEILKGLGENPSDIAIISADFKNGPITGLGLVKEARAAYPYTRIIVLIDSPERAQVVEGFRAGADGVFSRDEPFEMLCKCIRTVCEGQIWASSEQLRYVIEALARGESQPIKGANGTPLLTKRENELVKLVAEGLTNRDVARQLSLTEHTVRNYLFRIFNKLGTSNRLELALYVMKQRAASRGSDFHRACLAEPARELSAGRSAGGTGSPALSSNN
jgi:DNA-binding NarL/FixJ family response regulator